MSTFSWPFVLDGATGTELLKRGMKKGDCTERFVLEHPEVIQALQREYIEAGSDAVLAPTFGANRPTLMRHGYTEKDVEPVCRKLFQIAKENAGKVKVGADLSPTGLMLKPYGYTEPEEVYEIYREEAAVLLDCGADFFFIETMISAAEARQAVRAVRDLSKEIPVFVSMTVNENGRTMSGDALDAVLVTLLPYQIQGFGCNCSIGPDVIARALAPAAPIAKKHGMVLIAKPNAGMPVTDEQGTQFPLTPEDMAAFAEHLTGLGTGIFGGCCGTTPAHIQAMKKAVTAVKKDRFADVLEAEEGTYVSTARIWSVMKEGAEYITIDADSEDDIYDLMDESESEDILYLELKEGAADLLIEMDAFILNPIAVCGDEGEVVKLEKELCRKVR